MCCQLVHNQVKKQATWALCDDVTMTSVPYQVLLDPTPLARQIQAYAEPQVAFGYRGAQI